MKCLFLTILLFACINIKWASSDDALSFADIAYGEYLSGECVTCHQNEGASMEIPSIFGRDAAILFTIIKAYKNKELDNEVMQLVAGRLDDEQIASLAIYFESIESVD